jgi:S-adenosylmethionine:tRNA ribosyltransferase-isomerase
MPNSAASRQTAGALNAARAREGGSCRWLDRLTALESAASDDGRLHAFSGETARFSSRPVTNSGCRHDAHQFPFAAFDAFMLVSAFSGLDTMKHAYAHAIAAGYRFYSMAMRVCFTRRHRRRRAPPA